MSAKGFCLKLNVIMFLDGIGLSWIVPLNILIQCLRSERGFFYQCYVHLGSHHNNTVILATKKEIYQCSLRDYWISVTLEIYDFTSTSLWLAYRSMSLAT